MPDSQESAPSAGSHATPDSSSNANPAASPKQPESAESSSQASAAYLHGIEDTRRLMQFAVSEGQAAKAVELLGDLVQRVEQNEGRTVAMQTAFSEACNFERHRQFDAAIGAFELFQSRFPESMAVADSMLRAGECRIEQTKYAEAQAILRRVINEHGDSQAAKAAWRKLALVQLLAGQYDDSLATLEGMDQRYKGTHLSEYAKVRRAYVLVASNRVEDGKNQYNKFLKECSGSKYCRFAQVQLAKLK